MSSSRRRLSAAWQSVRGCGASLLTSARGAAAEVAGEVTTTFSVLEERRLRPILSGEEVAGCETGGTVIPALRRRHWLGVVGRLAAILLGLVLSLLLPVVLSAILVASGHGVAVSARRGLHSRAGMTVAGVELGVFLTIFVFVGGVALWAALVGFLLLMAVLVVWAWRVDMELVTTGKRLIRTRGLWMMRRQAFVPLDSIRATRVSGPFLFGIGSVTFDSASDEDGLLHGFGLMSDPDQWAAQVMALRRMHITSSD